MLTLDLLENCVCGFPCEFAITFFLMNLAKYSIAQRAMISRFFHIGIVGHKMFLGRSATLLIPIAP